MLCVYEEEEKKNGAFRIYVTLCGNDFNDR